MADLPTADLVEMAHSVQDIAGEEGHDVLLRQVIGNVFRRLRRERGITLRELAELAQVSVPYLSEIERGRKEPSSEILAAICRALELELSDLLAEVQFDLATVARRTLPIHLQTAAIRVQQSAPQSIATSPHAHSASAQAFCLVA
ncbi:helix-turn-helix transcriptional regulator [Kribbella sp. NPDC051952]|uniref:helix-turn-helix domain-containing protein n=1 Tax=Kribbella sp. NPDC051952 TaxID=3154851 RepID=UPI00341FE628